MNFADVVIILIVLGSVAAGWKSGLIRSVGNLLADLIALFIAWRVYDPVAGLVEGILHWSENICHVLAFILVFSVASALLLLLVYTIDRVFNWLAIIPFLKTINRAGGAVFGLLRGGLLISIWLFVLTLFPLWDWLVLQIDGAFLVPYFQPLLAVWSFLLPLALRQLHLRL